VDESASRTNDLIVARARPRAPVVYKCASPVPITARAPFLAAPQTIIPSHPPATAIAAAGVGVEVNLLFSITLRPSSARSERQPLSLSRSITRMLRYHLAPVDCETLHGQMEIKAGIPRYEFAGEHFRPINVRNYIHRGDGAVYHAALISFSLSLSLVKYRSRKSLGEERV